MRAPGGCFKHLIYLYLLKWGKQSIVSWGESWFICKNFGEVCLAEGVMAWHGWHRETGTGECEDYLTAFRGASGAYTWSTKEQKERCFLSRDFVSLGCHKVVSDHRALSLGRASPVLSISLALIAGMRLEKGIATSMMSRMNFLFVLYCLLPGFCHWIMGRSKGGLQSLFLRLRKEWEAGAGRGGKRTKPNLQQIFSSSSLPCCSRVHMPTY